MESNLDKGRAVRTGWASRLAVMGLFVLLFEGVSGLVITFAPFHPAVQWSVLVHTAVGAITLVPVAWYLWIHWKDYKRYAMSHVVLLGYVATVALLICAVSGVVVTVQGLFAIRMSGVWRQIHLISTFVTLGAALPHTVLVLAHSHRPEVRRSAWRFLLQVGGLAGVGMLVVAVLPLIYSGTLYVNEFPGN